MISLKIPSSIYHAIASEIHASFFSNAVTKRSREFSLNKINRPHTLNYIVTKQTQATVQVIEVYFLLKVIKVFYEKKGSILYL